MQSRTVRSNGMQALVLVTLAGVAGLAATCNPAWAWQSGDDWQFDLIHMRNGKVYQGLLVD